MQDIKQRFIVLAAASLLVGLLAACGSGSEDNATPSSLPLEETTTSIVDAPSTSAPVPDEVTDIEDDATAAPEMTVEMFESMLASESGRSLLVGSIAAETNIELDAAECLLDAIPLDVLVDAAGSFFSGEGAAEGGLFSADQMGDIAPILESCGIAQGDLTP